MVKNLWYWLPAKEQIVLNNGCLLCYLYSKGEPCIIIVALQLIDLPTEGSSTAPGSRSQAQISPMREARQQQTA